MHSSVHVAQAGARCDRNSPRLGYATTNPPECPPDHMRVLVQRVARAEVRVDERVLGRIGRGFLLLVGFTHSDGDEQLVWMADKVVGLRVFPDDDDKMNRSVADIDGSFLVVSQFTLYGDAVKGRRPSFIDAARPEHAIPLYEKFATASACLLGRNATGTTVCSSRPST